MQNDLTEQALLKRYNGDERATALAMFLDTQDTITSDGDNKYIVGEYETLPGTSPEQYMQNIADLRILLNANIENEISSYINTDGKPQNRDLLYNKAKVKIEENSRLGGKQN